MTDADKLREIRERREKATAGPWIALDECYCHYTTCEPCRWKQQRNDVVTCSQVAYTHAKHSSAYVYTEADVDPYRASDPMDDAIFIANAPTDIDFLLNRIDAYEKVVEAALSFRDAGFNTREAEASAWDALDAALDGLAKEDA